MATDYTLLIRAFDAESTFLSYRWLDDPDHPIVHALTPQDRARLLAGLDGGLITVHSDEAIRGAVTGPLTRQGTEYATSVALAGGLLPPQVRTGLRERETRGRIGVRITPSRSLARVPWELLVVEGDRRLIEVADLTYEPPAAIHVGRSRLPEPWAQAAGRPVCYVVDPLLPAGTGLDQVLGGRRWPGRRAFAEWIERREHTPESGVRKAVGRWDLHRELIGSPSRLVYFGHVSSTLDQPGSSSLHLHDEEETWGLAELMNNAHRPLSALDLLVGTSSPDLGPGDEEAPVQRLSGAQLWPMPPRVAVIACEGGADYRSSETFGLVTAIFTAGAEVITTTRWTLPSDSAFERFADVEPDPGPTVELALAVDYTHEQPDPVAALADWQRAKLAQWRADPGPATSPLTWAAVGCHVCPARSVTYPGDGR